jgi:hypothetical protein
MRQHDCAIRAGSQAGLAVVAQGWLDEDWISRVNYQYRLCFANWTGIAWFAGLAQIPIYFGFIQI